LTSTYNRVARACLWKHLTSKQFASLLRDNKVERLQEGVSRNTLKHSLTTVWGKEAFEASDVSM